MPLMSEKRHKIEEHELQGFKYFKAIAHHNKLKDLPGILTVVDGTLLKCLPKIA